MWKVNYTRIDPMLRHALVPIVVAVLANLMVPGTNLASPTILNFDDVLSQGFYNLTGSGYAGLTWETGNQGGYGNIGFWAVTATNDPYHYPYSQPRNVINAWGCTEVGIGFPITVNMAGGYIAGQGDGPFTSALRVRGYSGGLEVSTTGWFTNITTTPAWFDMSVLVNVDRILFESVAVYENGGFFGLDDLTFTPIPEPAGLAALGFVAAALLARRRADRRNRTIQEVAL